MNMYVVGLSGIDSVKHLATFPTRHFHRFAIERVQEMCYLSASHMNKTRQAHCTK